MAKHRRRRRHAADSWLGPAHPPTCTCAGDHCGQIDAARSARRRPTFSARVRLSTDDTRTYQLARNLGISVRRSRAP